jgi:hypothetical protein
VDGLEHGQHPERGEQGRSDPLNSRGRHNPRRNS